MLRHPKLTLETEPGASTAYGGLSLAAGLLSRLGAARTLNERLDLLSSHRPFTESDHVLAHVYNLFVGGTCLEDLANLQGSEAVLRMLGAARLPDPTTAGDFLRRFDEESLVVHTVEALDQFLDSDRLARSFCEVAENRSTAGDREEFETLVDTRSAAASPVVAVRQSTGLPGGLVVAHGHV